MMNAQKYSDAVVQVTAATPLIYSFDTLQPIEGTLVTKSNGTIFSANCMICPASTVMLPPSILSAARPLYRTTPVDGRIQNLYTPAAAVNVVINGMAQDAFAMNKLAQILGVSGINNIAVIQTLEIEAWNQGTGCIFGVEYINEGSIRLRECCNVPNIKPYPVHPHVRLIMNALEARSMCPPRDLPVGIPSCTVTCNTGEPRFGTGPAQCFEGHLVEPIFVDQSGWARYEACLVHACLPTTCYGQPIIDCNGCLLGMITGSYTGYFPMDNIYSPGCLFIGPNWNTIQCVVNSIIYAAGCTGDREREDVLNFCVGGCEILVYRQGYLGIAYEVFTGDYQFSRSYVSGDPREPTLILDGPSGKEIGAGPSIKQVQGLTLLGIAGQNPDNLTAIPDGMYYVPGGAAALAPLPIGTNDSQAYYCNCSLINDATFIQELGVSSLLGKIPAGSIITSIGIKGSNFFPLGQRACEVSLGSFLKMRARPGNQVSIAYVAANGQGGGTISELGASVANVCLSDLPPIADYPWEDIMKYEHFNDLGFSIPATQLQSPLLPQRINPEVGGFFWPSI